MRLCLYCARDNSCVNYAACSSLIMQTRCDLKPFAHFERESARGDSHRLFMKWCLTESFKLLYLMNKYELYLSFSIIIISPAPDRDWDGATACHAKPLTARASSARDQFFEISLFRDRQSHIPKRLLADNDRYPINRSTPNKCAISFIQQCIATRCFILWMNRVSQWFNGPFRWSHLFRFYWISRFERIVWYEWFSK